MKIQACEPLLFVLAYLLLHSTACIIITFQNRRNNLFKGSDFFLNTNFPLNLPKFFRLESISWCSSLCIAKERNLCANFWGAWSFSFRRSHLIHWFEYVYQFRDPDEKGLNTSMCLLNWPLPSRITSEKDQSWLYFHCQKYSLMNLLNFPFRIQSCILQILRGPIGIHKGRIEGY